MARLYMVSAASLLCLSGLFSAGAAGQAIAVQSPASARDESSTPRFNVDTTLVLAAPKIGPIAGELREHVADLLDIEPNAVGIKAKTPEGLSVDHVAQAHAVVLLEQVEDPTELKSMTAVIESQRQLEDVVKDLVSQVHGEPVRKPTFDTEDIT